MRWAGYVVGGVAIICGLGYLSWFNPGTVELRLSPEWVVRAPLAAQLTIAFLAGAILMLIGGAARASRRAMTRWRRERQERRMARVEALAEEGRRRVWAGDLDRGRTALLRAWRAQPRREVLLALAEAHRQGNKPEEARRLLQTAEAPFAEDPDVILAVAESSQAMGDTSGAIAALEHARGRYPRAARVLRELRDLYIDTGRWNEAATVQEERMSLNGQAAAADEQEVLAGLRFQATLQLESRADRITALEQLVARFPKFVPGAVQLGDELVAGARQSEATRLWEYTFRQQPRMVLAERLAALADSRQARDRLRATLKKSRSGEQLDPAAVHLVNARLWIEDGELDEAARELDAVPPPANESAEFQLAVAHMSEKRGQAERALKAYHRAEGAVGRYHCTSCGRAAETWQAYCSGCHHWGTHRASIDFAG